MVMLHVANSLPIQLEGVSVVPVGDFDASPSEFFIGEMSPQDFLPAHFEIPTAGLQQGEELAFKIVYRVGRETYETPELKAVLDLENPPLKLRPLYIIVPVVIVVGLGLFFWRLKRRGGLSTGTKGAKSI